MVTVSEEQAVDYALTARLATKAFADQQVQFPPDRIQSLYARRCVKTVRRSARKR